MSKLSNVNDAKKVTGISQIGRSFLRLDKDSDLYVAGIPYGIDVRSHIMQFLTGHCNWNWIVKIIILWTISCRGHQNWPALPISVDVWMKCTLMIWKSDFITLRPPQSRDVGAVEMCKYFSYDSSFILSVVCHGCHCKLFSFSTFSPEPLGQFKPNLAQCILW